eukprot:3500975-Pyramimonas_sp.AAC.1
MQYHDPRHNMRMQGLRRTSATFLQRRYQRQQVRRAATTFKWRAGLVADALPPRAFFSHLGGSFGDAHPHLLGCRSVDEMTDVLYSLHA